MTHKTTDDFFNDLDGFDTAMLVTHDSGDLRARPMSVRIDKAGKTIRFLTSVKTHKLDEIERDARANAVFSDDSKVWISVSGKIRISRDQKDIDELWSSAAEAWLNAGKSEAAVLILEPSMGEYWDNSTNVVKAGWEMAKAVLSDNERPDIGKHAKVDL